MKPVRSIPKDPLFLNAGATDLVLDLSTECQHAKNESTAECQKSLSARLKEVLETLLQKFEEPSLRRDDYTAYRFISWPVESWSGRYMSIRAVRNEGHAVLVAKIFQDPGNLGSGIIEWRLIREMSPTEWATLESEVQKVRLWELPTLPPEDPRPQLHLNTGPIRIFEAATPERHTAFFEEFRPNETMPALQRVMWDLLKCSGGAAG